MRKLNKEEQDIEKELHNFVPIDNEKSMKAMIEEAAKNHVSRKKQVSIRVAEKDLEAMKIKATKMGVPYQTYINILIHRDATGQI